MTINLRTTLSAVACVLAAGAALLPLRASAEFPEKPIKLVVGFRAGGGTDALATALAREMEAVLGQPVVKEIKAGAGGGKAAASVKTAKPDGYTLLMAVTPTFAFNTAAIPDKTPYTKDDFDYLGSLAKGQEAVYAKSDAPFKTWQEMIFHAKAGNDLTYAAVTPFDKLFINFVNKREGTSIKTIPTKGGSGAMRNVLGGHTDLGFSGGNHIRFLGKGDVRVLASMRSERLPDSPSVPTLIELGYPVSFEAHFLIAAPKGLPSDTKAKLLDAIRRGSQGQAMRDVLKKLPFPEEQLGPDGLRQSIDAAHARYVQLVDELK